ncbi:pentapeptide repeat-containing protein [Alphaproteobacteria bacterium KMM 3653]|uniref:Pentapeptide repeat-containing protein n=1 Tax=Harenicola maris TaxID=2841044 RepID=A0AAP2CMK3_9RHOB|nr:pentapeptide repeat-containing protein [Harenicola maris]
MDWIEGFLNAPLFLAAVFFGLTLFALTQVSARPVAGKRKPFPMEGLWLWAWMVTLAAVVAASVWFFATHETAFTELRNVMLFVAGVVGAPFVLWRAVLAKRQVDTAEAVLTNQKLSSALDGLSAVKKATLRCRNVSFGLEGRKYSVFETSGEEAEIPSDASDVVESPWELQSYDQPDIVARNMALDRLEGLAMEDPELVQRIAGNLAVYVREVSAEAPAEQWSEALELLGQDIDEWASSLTVKRSDAQSAVQVLTRLQERAGGTLKIDLRRANLQGFELADMCLQGFDLGSAHLEGANLWRADLRRAFLPGGKLSGVNLGQAKLDRAEMDGARLDGADLHRARLVQVDLSRANLEGAKLLSADMEGADLSEARLQGADLRRAKLVRADLSDAKVDSATDFRSADLTGAFIEDVDLSEVTITQEQACSMFGDASVILPEGIKRPAHWPEWDMEWDDLRDQWKIWTDDPTSYTPPENPS